MSSRRSFLQWSAALGGAVGLGAFPKLGFGATPKGSPSPAPRSKPGRAPASLFGGRVTANGTIEVITPRPAQGAIAA